MKNKKNVVIAILSGIIIFCIGYYFGTKNSDDEIIIIPAESTDVSSIQNTTDSSK